MARINILTSDVYNRISAGEVVERPKSVIKELVENSIDAGADSIVIEIEDGGTTLMRVSDNGFGIEREYVKTAFLPHATSKVSKYEDLEQVATLGFRGEALPSISAVSNLELTTKSQNEDTGTKIVLRGGEVTEHTECDCNNGATFTVRNLFYNTPARQKFLKKAKSEESDITAVVQGLILANPDISFKYFADGKMIYSSNGKGLESAVYSVYPTAITKSLLYFEHNSGNITVRGYISTPELTKATRGYQTTVINGRLIKNILIETAVMKAYGNMLMKRSFPVFILDILMPFDMLDINVTPSKTDVRFVDERVVFSAIYRAVESALSCQNKIFGSVADNDSLFVSTNKEESTHNTTAVKKTEQIDFVESESKNNSKNSVNIEQYTQNRQIISEKLSDNTASSSKLEDLRSRLAGEINTANNIKDKAVRGNVTAYEDISSRDKKEENKTPPSVTSNTNSILDSFKSIKADTVPRFTDNSSLMKARDTSAVRSLPKIDNDIKSDLFSDIEKGLEDTSVKILGQIFNTYVIAAKGNSMYLIDQHAAHERMLYDKLMSKIDSENIVSQPLLVPQIITLSPQDMSIIADYIAEFASIGLYIEQFSEDSYKVNSVPSILGSFDANKFIDYILADRNKFAQIKVKDLLHEKLAMTACKAAIKGGHQLKDIEINALVRDIEQNKPVQCPHGRPTIIKLSKTDIDKMFKRIV